MKKVHYLTFLDMARDCVKQMQTDGTYPEDIEYVHYDNALETCQFRTDSWVLNLNSLLPGGSEGTFIDLEMINYDTKEHIDLLSVKTLSTGRSARVALTQFYLAFADQVDTWMQQHADEIDRTGISFWFFQQNGDPEARPMIYHYMDAKDANEFQKFVHETQTGEIFTRYKQTDAYGVTYIDNDTKEMSCVFRH